MFQKAKLSVTFLLPIFIDLALSQREKVSERSRKRKRERKIGKNRTGETTRGRKFDSVPILIQNSFLWARGLSFHRMSIRLASVLAPIIPQMANKTQKSTKLHIRIHWCLWATEDINSATDSHLMKEANIASHFAASSTLSCFLKGGAGEIHFLSKQKGHPDILTVQVRKPPWSSSRLMFFTQRAQKVTRYLNWPHSKPNE